VSGSGKSRDREPFQYPGLLSVDELRDEFSRRAAERDA